MKKEHETQVAIYNKDEQKEELKEPWIHFLEVPL